MVRRRDHGRIDTLLPPPSQPSSTAPLSSILRQRHAVPSSLLHRPVPHAPLSDLLISSTPVPPLTDTHPPPLLRPLSPQFLLFERLLQRSGIPRRANHLISVGAVRDYGGGLRVDLGVVHM